MNIQPQFSAPESHSFNVAIATRLKSSNAAAVFNHIFFWLRQNKQRGINQISGRTWMYDSIQDISFHFPYMTYKQTRTAVELLVDHGYLIKAQLSKNKMDNRNWYALANEDWLVFQNNFTESPTGPNGGHTRPTDGHTRPVIYKDTHNNTDNNKDMSEQPFGRLTSFFFEKLREINPKIKPPNLDRWCKEISYLIRLDNRSEDEVKAVIEYVVHQHKNPTSDFTWSQAVISPVKLRKHFATIWLEMHKKTPEKAKEDVAKNKMQIFNDNFKWMKDIEKRITERLKKIPHVQVRVSDNSVHLSNKRGSTAVGYMDYGFRDLVEKFLKTENVI